MQNGKDIDLTQDKKALAKAKRLRKKRFLRIIGLLLIIAGIVVIGYPLSTFIITNRAQDRLQSEWTKKLKAAANPGNPEPEVPADTSDENKTSRKNKVPPGKAAFRLLIPRIDFDMIVVEGADPASLKLGPGHISNSAQPGEKGACIISGHRTTYGAPFFSLDRVKKGDEIVIETERYRFAYRVFDVRTVRPNDSAFLKLYENPVLALTTCTPIHSARDRLVVLGALQ